MNDPEIRSVAAMVAGDKVAFYHCAFYSPHHTLFDSAGRHYYESCYIQGNIDFIFGSGQSIFQCPEIFVRPDRRTEIRGSITAQVRQEEDSSGFVFLKGKVYGVGEVYLGRVTAPDSRVIFADTYLSKTIHPAGWTTIGYSGSTEYYSLHCIALHQMVLRWLILFNLICGSHACMQQGDARGVQLHWAGR